ncbi:MAG: hypothetical protein JNL70_12915 [Saprospiraceae bacterium]|nr:hypothetical protein [Saprospiraceae bacterium]
MDVKRFLLAFVIVGVVFLGIKMLFSSSKSYLTSSFNKDGIHRWQIATTWNNNLPLLQSNIESMLKEINTLTSGRLVITLTDAPKDAQGNIIPMNNPLNLLHAVSAGDIQAIHAASYYWKSEIPAAVYFGSVPFGLEHGEVKQWLDNGGMTLWRDLYKHYGFYATPFSCGHTGNQMGGWFKKEIHSVADLRHLRIRIAGLGGEVMKNCFDALPSTQLPSEIFAAMQNGSLDAAEWIGPYDDYRLGLHTLGAIYYEPGWQEPNTMFELLINKDALNALPTEIKTILTQTIEKYDSKIYQDYIDQNQTYRRILENKMKVSIRWFPTEVIKSLYKCTRKSLEDYNLRDTSGFSDKIYQSYISFRGKSEY